MYANKLGSIMESVLSLISEENFLISADINQIS